MGCVTSKPTGSTTNSGKYKGSTRRSTTESKIQQALIKKKMEHAIDEKPLTFERILLKFDKLRVVIGYVRKVFQEVAKDGKMDHEGLKEILKRLEVSLTNEDIFDLFDFVDVSESHNISIKEFLVALTIGMVLDAIPALNDTEDVNGEKKPVMKRSFSGLFGHNGEIKEMLNLMVSAYLMFDPDGKGFIERSGVEKMVEEHGHKPDHKAMLSQQRWKEMDWDANGTIDFAEFIFAFTSWFDIDEDDEE